MYFFSKIIILPLLTLAFVVGGLFFVGKNLSVETNFVTTSGEASAYSALQTLSRYVYESISQLFSSDSSKSTKVIKTPTPTPSPSETIDEDSDLIRGRNTSPSEETVEEAPLEQSNSNIENTENNSNNSRGDVNNYYPTYVSSGVNQVQEVASQVNQVQETTSLDPSIVAALSALRDDLERIRSFENRQTIITQESAGNSTSGLSDDLSTLVETVTLTVSGNTTLTSLTAGASTLSTLTVTGGATFDTDTLTIDSTNNRVGVGTTSPTDTFSVNGPIYLADVSPSTTGNRIYANGGDLFYDGNMIGGATTGNWTTDSTSVWRTTGNVGIGTTTPWAQLSVNPNGISGPSFAIGSSTATHFSVTNGGKVVIGNIQSSFGALTITQPVDGSILGGIMLYESDGSNAGGIFRESTNFGSLVFRNQSVNTLYVKSGKIGIGSSTPYANLSVTNTGTDPSFVVEDSTSPDTTPFIIDESGNVGVGTTSPKQKLSVTVGANYSAAAEYSGIGLTSGGSTWSTGYGIGRTSVEGHLGIAGGSGAYANGVVAGDMFLGTQTSANLHFGVAGTIKQTIKADGKIGIGTTSPSAKFSITQSANTNAGGLWISESGNTDFRSMYMDTSGILSFNGGDTAGVLNTATLNAAGAWTNASDISYKENIADLSVKYGLDTVLQTKPRFYTMKGTGQSQVGFIAQEMKLLIPEVVEGKEGSMGISYGNLVAVAFQAIKDLNEKIENIIADIKNIFAKELKTEKLCLEDVCITKDELKEILDNNQIDPVSETSSITTSTTTSTSSTASTSTSTSTPTPTPTSSPSPGSTSTSTPEIITSEDEPAPVLSPSVTPEPQIETSPTPSPESELEPEPELEPEAFPLENESEPPQINDGTEAIDEVTS